MTDIKPTSFEDLSVAELRRSAVADFAVDVNEKDSKKIVIAALAESGVGWSDYVAQHPEVAPEPVVEAVVVTTPTPVVEVVEDVEDKVLLKMERENPVFETRGYRFTTENPYVLVSPKHADLILENEVGFRQARPSEAREYYS